ncbi:hypothetical protein A2999_01465 [Candidatus Wolfebacteria bacterium RIFCSPLOWO2_01_FULL_38_11]|nr:MAG: hypothetical protein A2999_01465 [Candidatus Wolfebacteria bacterium RIFCSPLOWO2_01_FULL_38_11]
MGLGWFLFSFAAGLSMIVLPCTLPLAFVIVPLSMGKGYVKGFMVALAFGLGVAITLSTYGILAALLGKAFFAYASGGGEIIKNIFYAIAGTFAILFALSELKLIKFRIPSYMGAAPKFVEQKSDILKALFLGLFLGNIGIGCPHPATPIILGQIGLTADVFYGWLLFFVHAIGRIIPLLLLAILGILGVNATRSLLKHKESIARATAWGMVFVGAFLFTLGFFSHDWWVYSGMHTLLEEITQEERMLGILKGRWESAVTHIHGIPTGTGFFGLPLWLGNWVFVSMMVLPLWGYWLSLRRKLSILVEPEQGVLKKELRLKKFKYSILTIVFALTFIYILPQRFLSQQLAHQREEAGDTHKMEALAVDVGEIGKRADDLLQTIFRRENGKVIVELKTEEIVAEIAPGVTYQYWTYNGTVPGPFIKVKEGDTIEVRLTHMVHDHANIDHSFNISAFPISIASADEDGHNTAASEHEKAGHAKHSIDLHAVEGPGGGAVLTQTVSGQTTAFQFKATRPGIYVYHCASPHIPTHVANGMYGLILVEPKNGLAKVDKEFYVMQGEFYTNGVFGEKGHQEFSLEKMKKEEPEYFVFNGRVGSLSGTRALRAKVGETIRLYFGVGSHIASNFHIIGGVLDKLYPEGDIISAPHRNVQTTVVPPGGAMMAEFKLEVPGKYLLVDHSLSRAIDKGAIGEIIVEGEENPEIFKKIE